MKLQNLKRALGLLLVGLIGVNSIGFSVAANDNDYTGHFTYTVADGIATITAFDNQISEVIVPESVTIDEVTYKAEDNTLLIGKGLFSKSTVEKVTFPENYSSIGNQQMFYNSSTIKEVIMKSTAEDYNLYRGAFANCPSLEKIYIYAKSLTYTQKTSMFTKVPSNAIAYVMNDSVKSTLEELGWPGTIIVNPNMGGDTSSVIKTALSEKIAEIESFLSGIEKNKYTNIEALETELANAKTVYNNESATQDDVNNATNSLVVAFNAVTADKTALAGKITEAEELLSSIGTNTYKYTGVNALNTVLFNAKKVYDNNSATVTEVDNEVADLTSAISNVALANTNKSALLGEINSCKTFAEGKKNTDYDNLNELTSAISSAQIVYNNGDSTQDEIDNAWEKLRAARQEVTKKDTSYLTDQINELIQQAVALNSKDYTKDSWSAVETAIAEAQAIEDGLVSQYSTALQNLKSAIEGLQIKPLYVEEPGEPIALIQKNAVETTLGEFTADDNTAGATKIKITFDCASDVSFNQYASIEVKATINGTENYMKFAGTDSSQTAGAKGWTVELPLTNAINSGNDVMLVAYTWAWSNASDYVYAVTKVEYINDVGQVVKVVTDRTLALDELKTTIAEAELISGETYTEDSYAELTAALTAAKDVSDDAEKADIEAAKTALETAVAGLVEKTDDSVSEPTPDSEPDSESSFDTDDTDSETSSKTDDESSSQTDDSSSKTDDSANESTSKTDSADSDSKANTTNNANSGANGTSNPNTGAKSAAAVGIILLSAIGVIASRKK